MTLDNFFSIPTYQAVQNEIVLFIVFAYIKAIDDDFMMINDVLAIDMRALLVGHTLQRWSVDCSAKHSLDPKEHHLWLKNSQTLYGVESAALAPGYATLEASK